MPATDHEASSSGGTLTDELANFSGMNPGASLGPYRIDREIGAGGMGKVYAATGPDGVVALKVVHPHLLETPGFFKRFMREAQLGQSIRHENVVRTIDCDQEFADGKPQCFLVMEYVEGQTLSELLDELERVPEELCRHVAREICKGLSAIHDAGVVHRDLKPENVLIAPDHVVKVMDLGVAKLSDEAMKLSRSGAFVGSVEYAAPEQFRGGEVDGRTDLHALGVLLYELATGQHPYRGGSFHEVLGRVCDQDARRLGEINPQLSAFFEEVVHTLLVKDPRGRFASATQLLEVLEGGEDSPWWHQRARSLQAETKRPIRRIRIPRETAVYGRNAELATLRELYDRAKSGDGRVVLIEGEAGIGKSRLVDELIARLHADGEDLNFLFGSYPPGGMATADGGFSSAYRGHFGDAGSAAFLPENQILVPAFDALLRGEGAPEGAQALTQGSLQTCFVRATQSLAAERTTVVLIDDLHFAPDEGRALFSSLAMAVPGHRVLLIGSTRPGVSEEWRAGLTRRDQTTHLPVERLGPKDLAKLLEDSFRSEDLALRLAGKIGAKSDGNPFFAFEIIRGLREGQFITRKEDGSWISTRVIEEIEIPSSVRDLVTARVASLTPEERDVLDIASCLGFDFDPALIAVVTGIARIPLFKLLAQVERAHRLVRSSGRRFVFDHHQVQEALYDAFPEVLREEYHAALAEAIEASNDEPDGSVCVDLCEHFLRGGQGERIGPYLPLAQTHLAHGHLHGDYVSLTRRALSVPGLLRGGERATVLARMAAISGPLDRLGRASEREEPLREAIRLFDEQGEHRARDQAEVSLSDCLRSLSRLDEARDTLERCLTNAIARGDAITEADARMGLGIVLIRGGHHPREMEQFERAREIQRAEGVRRGEARAIINLGISTLTIGDFEKAELLLREGLEISRECNDVETQSRVLGNLGLAYANRNRHSEAIEFHEQALALARQLGFRFGEAIALCSLAGCAASLGDFERADRYFDAQWALHAEIQAPYLLGIAVRGAADVADERGDFDEAVRLHERAMAIQADCDRPGLIATRVDLAGVRIRRGEFDAAREILEEELVGARERREAWLVAWITASLAVLPGGDIAAAEEAVAAAPVRPFTQLCLFRATGDRAYLERAKAVVDQIVADNAPEFRSSLQENVRAHREILAAWREEFGDDDDDSAGDASAGDSPTESPTRAG